MERRHVSCLLSTVLFHFGLDGRAQTGRKMDERIFYSSEEEQTFHFNMFPTTCSHNGIFVCVCIPMS